MPLISVTVCMPVTVNWNFTSTVIVFARCSFRENRENACTFISRQLRCVWWKLALPAVGHWWQRKGTPLLTYNSLISSVQLEPHKILTATAFDCLCKHCVLRDSSCCSLVDRMSPHQILATPLLMKFGDVTVASLASFVGSQRDATRICCWAPAPVARRVRSHRSISDLLQPAGRSAANLPVAVAAVNQWDRQTDRQMDGRWAVT